MNYDILPETVLSDRFQSASEVLQRLSLYSIQAYILPTEPLPGKLPPLTNNGRIMWLVLGTIISFSVVVFFYLSHP
jgi:hypothetical protein